MGGTILPPGKETPGPTDIGGTLDCPPNEVGGGDETIARAEVEILADVAAG